MTAWEKERETLYKQASDMIQEANSILRGFTSESPQVDQVKQAYLQRIYANLKYVDYCNAVLGQ